MRRPALREQTARAAGAGVLKTAALATHRHAHVGGLGPHAELVEQSQQMRVGTDVVHDEPAVDRHRTRVRRDDVVGVRVPAEPVVGLEQVHVEAAL